MYAYLREGSHNVNGFEGAVGAALAANDKPQAEIWLRQALERYPRDPAVLSLAARFEQARGDNQRAADYYRASLAAMPSTSPAEKLAHVLVYMLDHALTGSIVFREPGGQEKKARLTEWFAAFAPDIEAARSWVRSGRFSTLVKGLVLSRQ